MSDTPNKKIEVIKAKQAPKRTSTKRGPQATYPFDILGVGDCFMVPDGKLTSLRNLVSQKKKVAEESDKQLPIFSIALASDGHYYVWRDS